LAISKLSTPVLINLAQTDESKHDPTMPGQPTTQKDRENITARLFRRESVPDIARTTGISKKTIWRISYNLKTYGTAVAPREDKPRGRPPLLTKEEHEVNIKHPALGNLSAKTMV
jgi:biotin operon repressor